MNLPSQTLAASATWTMLPASEINPDLPIALARIHSEKKSLRKGFNSLSLHHYLILACRMPADADEM